MSKFEKCNWMTEVMREKYGEFYVKRTQKMHTVNYNGYIVSLEKDETINENGTKLIPSYWIMMRKFVDIGYGFTIQEETYCIQHSFNPAEAWKHWNNLQLDSTSSAIQTARNPWCETLGKALEQGQLWIEQNNQVITFEPDFDEFVIEIWSQYRLQNGALTTMSYCANIWEDELPVNIRKAVFGV